MRDHPALKSMLWVFCLFLVTLKLNTPLLSIKGEQIKFISNQLVRASRDHQYTYVDLLGQPEDKNDKLHLKFASPDCIHLDNLDYSVWIKFRNQT
jgi:hypothetical protein